MAWHFITSRGKLKSNALKAQAVKASAPSGLFGGENWGKVLTTVKDVAQVAGATVPGRAGEVARKVVTATEVLQALDRLRPTAAGGKQMIEALRVVVPALNPDTGMEVLKQATLYGPTNYCPHVPKCEGGCKGLL